MAGDQALPGHVSCWLVGVEVRMMMGGLGGMVLTWED